jgi:hypothetical protein
MKSRAEHRSTSFGLQSNPIVAFMIKPVAQSKNNWNRIGDTFVYIPLFLLRTIPKDFQYFRLIVGVWLLCFHCLEKRDIDRSRKVWNLQGSRAGRQLAVSERDASHRGE